MLLVPLIVVGLSMSGVISGSPFDFRRNCFVSHLGTTISAKCDGESKYILTKDLFLDSRSTGTLSEMDLTNFQSVTLDSSVQVHKIKIKNTKNVSLYISSMQLKELIIESVEMLTFKHESSNDSMTRKMDGMVLLNVNSIQIISEKRDNFSLSVNKVDIRDVNDLGLEYLHLHITAQKVTIINTHIRFKGQSSLLLEGSSANITESVVYIHDGGYFTIKGSWAKISGSKVDVEDGVLLLKSANVIVSENSLYGFGNKSLSISGNVKLEKNDIFTSDIVHFLSLKSRQLIFTDNNFDCTVCGLKDKLLAKDLKDVGDINYCYADCKLSLNKYKEMLNNYCVCSNGELTATLPLLCAPCSLNTEINSNGGNAIFLYIILAALLFILILLISCFVCYKWKFPHQRESGQRDSQVVIYRKAQNDEDNSDNCYEQVGE